MPINQFSSGHGDNVAGDKHNHQYISVSLDLKDVANIAHDALLTLAIDGCKEAKKRIDPYKKLTTLSVEAVNLFEILLSFIDSIENGELMATDLLKSELKNEQSFFYEMYQAILVKVLTKNSIEEARKVHLRFSKINQYYLSAVYDQFFATKEELEAKFNNELYILDDYSLFYLTQGLLRIDSHQRAYKTLNQISFRNQSENIQYWIIATELNSIIFSHEKMFSYVHRDVSRKIENISNRFLELISDKNSLELLAVKILIAFINLTKTTLYLPEINKIGLKFRKDVSKQDKDLGETLDQIAEKKPFLVPNWVASKLKTDQSFNEEELEILIKALIQKSIDLDLFKNWIKQSNIIVEPEFLDANIMEAFFISFTNFENDIEKNEYRVALNTLLDQYSSQLTNVSPGIIKYWCNNLFKLGDAFEVAIYNILKNVGKDLNVNSDLNYYYLQSLLRLDKLETLGAELKKIEEHEWNHDLYLFQARYYLKTESYEQAQIAYDKFIHKEKSLYVWYEYLVSCMAGGKDTNLARQQLSRIPVNLLSANDSNLQVLLFQIGNFIDFDFAEQIIVRLFIRNPEKNAPITAKFYLNSLHLKAGIALDKEKSFEGAYNGVIYDVDGKRNQKILVDGQLAIYRELIGIHSPLGQLLSNMDKGEQVTYRFSVITLVALQPIATTVYELAMQIVSESQHNYAQPVFYQIELKKDMFIEQDSAYIQEIKSENPTEQTIEDFLRSSDLPLYAKGEKVNKAFLVDENLDIVHSLLLNKYANQCLLKTYDGVTDFNTMVIDIYGAVYLCMTNLYKSIIASKISVYISYETRKLIQFWIDDVVGESFLSLGEYPVDLIKTGPAVTYDMRSSLIRALEVLINYSTTETTKKIDLPTIVSEMKGLVSPSILSSIKLALSHKVPWLCLDSVIGQFIVKDTKCELVNFHYLVNHCISDEYLTSTAKRQALEYNAFHGLYTQYYLTDLIELSKDLKNLPLITRLLNNTSLILPNSVVTVSFLAQLTENIIPIGFEKRIITNIINGEMYLNASTRNNMYNVQGSYTQAIILENALYACFSKAIRSIEEPTVEERLAHFIIGFRLLCKNDHYLNYFYNVLRNFISGHFLSTEDIDQSLKRLLKIE